MNKKLQRLAEPGVGLYLFFLVAFAAAALFFKNYYLSAAEAGAILLLLIYSRIVRPRRARWPTALTSCFSTSPLTISTSHPSNGLKATFAAPARRRFSSSRTTAHS